MPVYSPAVELTRDLIRMNTVNPPGNEAPAVRWLGDKLYQAGFRIRYVELEPGRDSLIATIGDPDSPALCFTGHIDTVPEGGAAWSVDPFAAVVDGDRLYGRGSSDMKSGLAAFITAALNLAPRLEGTPGLELVITASEENGCRGAVQLAQEKLLGNCGAMIVAEPTGNFPYLGHKGALWLRCECRGLAAHGSAPHLGDNAIFKAVRSVATLADFRFSESHPVMGNPTLNVGLIKGGMAPNAVPDSCEFVLDIRTVPGLDHSALKSRLRDILPEVEAFHELKDMSAVWTDPASDWVRHIFDIAENRLDERPEPAAINYFTDGGVLHNAYGGIPTVIWGPGESHLCHIKDEYCFIPKIDTAVHMYEQAIRQWCGL